MTIFKWVEWTSRLILRSRHRCNKNYFSRCPLAAIVRNYRILKPRCLSRASRRKERSFHQWFQIKFQPHFSKIAQKHPAITLFKTAAFSAQIKRMMRKIHKTLPESCCVRAQQLFVIASRGQCWRQPCVSWLFSRRQNLVSSWQSNFKQPAQFKILATWCPSQVDKLQKLSKTINL